MLPKGNYKAKEALQIISRVYPNTSLDLSLMNWLMKAGHCEATGSRYQTTGGGGWRNAYQQPDIIWLSLALHVRDNGMQLAGFFYQNTLNFKIEYLKHTLHKHLFFSKKLGASGCEAGAACDLSILNGNKITPISNKIQVVFPLEPIVEDIKASIEWFEKKRATRKRPGSKQQKRSSSNSKSQGSSSQSGSLGFTLNEDGDLISRGQNFSSQRRSMEAFGPRADTSDHKDS